MSYRAEFAVRGRLLHRDANGHRASGHRAFVPLALVAVFLATYWRGQPVVDVQSTVNFEQQVVQFAGPEHILFVRNSGSSSLNVSSVLVAGFDPHDFSVVRNNCVNQKINAGQSCQLGVRFVATAPGERSAILMLLDDARDNPQIVTLAGIGTSQIGSLAGLVVTPKIVRFAAQIGGLPAPLQSLTLRNAGSSSLTIQSIHINSDDNAFAIASDPCTASSLASGGTCAVTLQFSPTHSGAYTGHLTVTNSSGREHNDAALDGRAMEALFPVATIRPPGLEFGNQEMGKSAIQRVTIENTGKATLLIGRINVVGEGSGEFTLTPACANSELVPGATCTLDVQFVPSGLGRHSADIVLQDNDQNGPQEVALSGAGILPPPALKASAMVHPDAINFGNEEVGKQSQPQAIVVTSSGNVPITIQEPTLEGTSRRDFKLIDLNCGSRSLRSGETCSLSVFFEPKGTFGKYPSERSAQIMVDDSAGLRHQIQLSGVATRRPVSSNKSSLNLNPNQLDFGSQTAGSRGQSQIVTVTNTGSDRVEVSGSILDDAFTGLFTQRNSSNFIIVENTCQATLLLPGNQCVVGVAFTPRQSGNLRGALMIGSAALLSRDSVSLSGVGMSSPAATNPAIRAARVTATSGFCCIRGKGVSYTTQQACSQSNGTYYDDQVTANNACTVIP